MIGKDLALAKQQLLNENLVAIPTETVYGLAANAFSKKAVAKVFEAKNRPAFNPLIVHTHSLEKVDEYVKSIPEEARKLAEAFWPGPLTLLLEKEESITDLVTAGSNRVAIRIPNHQLTLGLLRELDFPLVAPSANPYQYISPTHPEHVNAQLGERVSYILDGGRCNVGIESTIVGFDKGSPFVYRYGGIEVEKLESCLGKKIPEIHQPDQSDAPGLQKLHYSPAKKVMLGNPISILSIMKKKKFGVLSFSQKFSGDNVVDCKVLSANRNMVEAAGNFFHFLHELDKLEIDAILAEKLPDSGLGVAINDRLKRASGS